MNLEIPGLESFTGIFSVIFQFLPYILVIIALAVIYKVLTKKRNYSRKIVEVKESPIEINNLLRDSVKRNVIRALRKEKKYMTAISKEINETAPRLRYHLKQLEKAHILKSFKLAREAYFTLTKEGEWCLDAINYYYPQTNLQFIVTRLKRIMGISKMKKLTSRKNKTFAETKSTSTNL